MKKLLLSTLFLVFFAVAANAQSDAPSSTANNPQTVQQDKKKEIKQDELPQAVKTTLATDAYKGWEVVKVWHNETKDNYEIEVKNATEAKTIKFDKDGKEIK